MKGYRNEEVIGKNIAIFYTPDAVASGEPEKNLRAAAAGGSFETEGWRVRKDGSVFWADVMITPVYDADGKIEGFTKVTRDFSLHKRAEDEIKETLQKEKELNAMKSNFVSLASHEFRTPLSTILTSIVLLEQYRTTETQDKRDRHIQRIRYSVNEMVNILEEFLSLEKIEERKVEVKYETFDLKQLSEHVRDKFATQLPRSDQIQFVHSGDLNVFLDRAILEHILTNLLSNAVKYSPEGREIVLETAVTAQYVELKVKDRGIGISPADQKHLFERFFRASNTGGIKGTGLGLHIVKRYVDLMKGTIRVKSNLGAGSEFAIMFFTEPAY